MKMHSHGEVVGLVDGCPRCEEHAATLIELDARNLRHIWQAPPGQRSKLDLTALNGLERAVGIYALLSQAYEYEHYDLPTGEGKVPPVSYREIQRRRAQG